MVDPVITPMVAGKATDITDKIVQAASKPVIGHSTTTTTTTVTKGGKVKTVVTKKSVELTGLEVGAIGLVALTAYWVSIDGPEDLIDAAVGAPARAVTGVLNEAWEKIFG